MKSESLFLNFFAGFFVLALLTPLARGDVFNLGPFNCITSGQLAGICAANNVFSLDAVVGVDTVYAPGGVTPLYTISDLVLENAIPPTLASEVQADTSQPALLRSNLAPFTTVSDLNFFESALASYNFTPEFLVQSGSLITNGITLTAVSGGETSPSIYPDLTGAVSNAFVTGDTVSLADANVYNNTVESGPGPAMFDGQMIPAGYTAEIVTSLVINNYIENITETETSAVPEPSSLVLGLTALIFPLLEMRRRSRKIRG